jgi:hypothetical protein
MPRTALAYERPSRVSQGLVACLSIAVVVMAGWLAILVMFFDGVRTMAADDADIQQPPTTRAYVTSVSPEPIRLGEPARANAADLEPSWVSPPEPAMPPVAPPPSRAALSLAPFAESPPDGARPPTYSTPSVTTSSDVTEMLDTSRRGTIADAFARLVEATVDDADTLPEVIPLPRPRPISVPVPRPRPQLDAEDAKPAPDQSLFDFLVSRQR